MKGGFPSVALADKVRISCLACGELAGADLGGAGGLALEVVGDELLEDGLLQGVLDELGGFFPSDVVEQHDAGEDHRAGVDDVLVGILRCSPVRGFKHRKTIADVGAGSDAETAWSPTMK